MALTKTHNRMIAGAAVSVTDFGAKGDGTTDDAAAIQAAVDYAFATGEPYSKVVFPTGNYLINTQIDRSGNGNYVDLVGEGQRNTIITAGAAIDSVFYLATPTDIAGCTTISDMTIRCASLANRGIDAENMRYWTLNNVEIIDAVVAGIRCGNWLTRIIGNKFDSCAIGVEVDGIDTSPSSANNLLIMQNDFGSCVVGCQVQSRSNDIKIEYNAFDACTAAGIWVREGGRSISIDKNYFESCGQSATVSVPIDNDVANNVTRGAAIIINHLTSSPTATTWTGQILDNIFANCNTTRYIVLTNVERGLIDQNDIHDSYLTASFVEILGYGCYTTCKEFILRGSYDSTECTKICDLNGLDPEDSYRNMVINNSNKTSTELAYFATNDPSSTVADWSGATTINTTAYQGTFKELEYDVVADGTNTSRELSITLEDASNIRDRFMRVTYATKGSSTSSGVWVQIYIDGSSVANFTKAASTYTNGAVNSVFYVPATATTLLIKTRGVSSSNNAKMVGFCVSDAAVSLRESPIARLA